MKRGQYAIKSVVVATAFVALALAWAIDRHRLITEIERLNVEQVTAAELAAYDAMLEEYQRDLEQASDSP